MFVIAFVEVPAKTTKLREQDAKFGRALKTVAGAMLAVTINYYSSHLRNIVMAYVVMANIVMAYRYGLYSYDL